MDKVEAMIRDIEAEARSTQAATGHRALDPRVIAALREVPRDAFVPPGERRYAYENGPLPIGHGQTISQPFIVALMTQLLDPSPEDVILEVGTGCGYQAAILARLVKHVYSVEQVGELAAESGQRLQHLGYSNVTVRHADGYYGWPEQAPFDGIIVTAAAPHVPEPLVEQLKPGARLVIPVGGMVFSQQLVVVEKKADGTLVRRDVLAVAFVPLTGQDHKRPAHMDPH